MRPCRIPHCAGSVDWAKGSRPAERLLARCQGRSRPGNRTITRTRLGASVSEPLKTRLSVCRSSPKEEKGPVPGFSLGPSFRPSLR